MLNTTAILSEGKREYLAKYADQPNVKNIVDKFWIIRHKLSSPKNDIDWWIDKPYSDLQTFVQNFDNRSKRQRRSDAHADNAVKCGANLLGYAGAYEVWWIPSHEAAQELGRLYRGKSAKWCISTENPSYFNYNYAENEFLFMIMTDGEPKFDGLEKLAIQMTVYDETNETSIDGVWDIYDENIYYDLDAGTESLVDSAVKMFNKSGLSRKKFINEYATKLAKDKSWLVKLFGHTVKTGERGGILVECDVDDLLDILDDYNGVSPDVIIQILTDDWYGAFENCYPDTVNFDEMDDVRKSFERITGKYGIKWNDLEKIWNGQDEFESIDDDTVNWIKDALNDNFDDGLGYAQIWYDCWINGTGQEAAYDIMSQLKQKSNIIDCRYSDEKHKYVLTFSFSMEDIMRITKLRLAGDDDDAISLSIKNDDGEYDKISVYEPDYDGWSNFDQDLMRIAATKFAKRLVGQITKQKDLPGQMFLPIDKITNPDNLQAED